MYPLKHCIISVTLILASLRIGDYLFPGFSELTGIWARLSGICLATLTFKLATWLIGPDPRDTIKE